MMLGPGLRIGATVPVFGILQVKELCDCNSGTNAFGDSETLANTPQRYIHLRAAIDLQLDRILHRTTALCLDSGTLSAWCGTLRASHGGHRGLWDPWSLSVSVLGAAMAQFTLGGRGHDGEDGCSSS